MRKQAIRTPLKFVRFFEIGFMIGLRKNWGEEENTLSSPSLRRSLLEQNGHPARIESADGVPFAFAGVGRAERLFLRTHEEFGVRQKEFPRDLEGPAPACHYGGEDKCRRTARAPAPRVGPGGRTRVAADNRFAAACHTDASNAKARIGEELLAGHADAPPVPDELYAARNPVEVDAEDIVIALGDNHALDLQGPVVAGLDLLADAFSPDGKDEAEGAAADDHLPFGGGDHEAGRPGDFDVALHDRSISAKHSGVETIPAPQASLLCVGRLTDCPEGIRDFRRDHAFAHECAKCEAELADRLFVGGGERVRAVAFPTMPPGTPGDNIARTFGKAEGIEGHRSNRRGPSNEELTTIHGLALPVLPDLCW